MRTTASCTSTRITHRRTQTATAALGLNSRYTKTIEVHDYESGIKTSQGEDRYVVSFFDPAAKEWGKFFTASEEMKNILDQISDIEDGFPFETVIVSEVFDGNKVKYKFS